MRMKINGAPRRSRTVGFATGLDSSEGFDPS
jgi:hypothetical protein